MNRLALRAPSLLALLVLLTACGGSEQASPTATSGATAVAAATGPADAPDEGGWREYTSQEGGYSVLLPGDPEEETINAENEGVEMRSVYARVDVGDTHYMVMHTDLPEEVAQLSPDVFFMQYQGRLAAQVESDSGRPLEKVEATEITLDGNPGREITLESEGEGGRVRTYLVDGRQYQLIVGGPVSSLSTPDATRFLDSFKLTR